MTKTTRSLTLLACLLATGTPLFAGEWIETPFQNRVVRTYQPHMIGDRSAPLLIGLHGEWSTAEGFSYAMPLEDLADRNRFRVVFLEGTPVLSHPTDTRHWNAGACCGDPVAFQVDDLSYLDQVIQAAIDHGISEPGNIFLLGQSNGAMMAYRYACAHPEKIRGVIGISGSLSVDACTSAKGLNVLHIHGIEDQIVPMVGGRGENIDPFDHRSTDDTLNDLHQAGARVEIIRLPKARHNIFDVNRHIQAQFEMSLSETVADFIDSYRIGN